MASRKAKAPRDTAKDIILGLAPSGPAPRQPKEGVATPKEPTRPTAPVAPTVVVDRRPDNSAIQGLQSRLEQLQKENRDLLQAEQNARKRLESNLGTSSRNYEDVQRQLATLDGKIMALNNDISALRAQLDRQMTDMMAINNEIMKRPVVDPSKISTSTQQLDGKVRDLHNQLMQMKQTQEMERNEKERENRALNERLIQLQDLIRQHEQARTDILHNLSRRDLDKEKISEEARRLNEKIGLITGEVTRNTTESQTRLRDDISQRYAALETALRLQSEKIAELERNQRMEKEKDSLAKQFQSEKNKNKTKFDKVNEALASLEKHLETGNKKMEKVLNAEIQARQLHEKGLLFKIHEMESLLHKHIAGLKKSIDEVKDGKNPRVPNIDYDALRRDMETIAADKNRLSLEGLLILEDKLMKVQKELTNDSRDLQNRVSGLDDNEATRKLKGQVGKLDSVKEDMDKTQAIIRDKVENQIPKDLNELVAKQENMKHQLNSRLDKEEEERYLAIKELQDAFQRLQTSNGGIADHANPALRREVDEVKVAIKKLAESVTTVKNVLDKKITDESIARQNDVARLEEGPSSK